MALNVDDLIGSMQHGFHAGDRGNEINEIRESLKMSLGQQHPSQHHNGASNAGPSNSQYAFAARRNPFQPQQPSSLDADVAMLSSSNSYQQQQNQQYYPQFFGAGTAAAGGGEGGPGSWGSHSSSSSNVTGWGFAPAPANTPQQTPVEASALARQLQAELEKQSSSSTQQHYAYSSALQHAASPTRNGVDGSSPPFDPPPPVGRNASAGGDEPRSYVNGFSPREDSATPVGRASMSPQPQPGIASPQQ
ncbi:uncharacterized protein SPSC_03596 [Sporisorium scitamineum]|uniref:Uncharacterized protein n=1 Tax=Sporisorium scitamineum TaxID=49012 RepID=A0A0F7S921_9BASI|nr:uncharacterized protein SPSC_03596 [Sporisorium scitamineum]CDW97188.1 hypothetical protein [Sporisorium scitamineum]